jgi:hypothetical protein
VTAPLTKLAAGIAASFLLLLPACVRGPVPLAARCPRYTPSTACPFGAHGVRVATNETENGLDVVLTAGPGGIEDLRNRAHYAIEGSTEPGMIPPAGAARTQPLSTKSTVEVQDVAAGVDIRVVALNPDDADDLRDEVVARLDKAADSSVCN